MSFVVIPCAFFAGACAPDAGDSPAGPEIIEIDVPAAAGSGQPFLAAGADGAAVLSWLEPGETEVALRYATLENESWSAAHTIVGSENLFVNWADVPSVVPLGPDLWAAHWLDLLAGSFGAYNVATAVSQDGGSTWSAATLLNDDGTETEHGFTTLFPWADASRGAAIGAVWLDGRELAEWSFDRPDALLGVSLRYARLAPDGTVVERGEIDSLVCDCCQTDVAVTAAGPIVIYRDRTEAEIRDVVVRRHVGASWLEPIALGAEQWQIEGCPVNGPAIDARGDDVAAAWFTAAESRPRVRFARSSDAGASFAGPVEIDADGAFGQVDVALLADATAVVSWWRSAPGGDTALAARTVARDGTLGPVHTVAVSDTAQPLDVPQILRVDDAVLFTWTGIEDGGRVRTALVRHLD